MYVLCKDYSINMCINNNKYQCSGNKMEFKDLFFNQICSFCQDRTENMTAKDDSFFSVLSSIGVRFLSIWPSVVCPSGKFSHFNLINWQHWVTLFQILQEATARGVAFVTMGPWVILSSASD